MSGTIAPEQLQADFPGKKLPGNAAFWIPSADLPPTAATQFHSEEVKPKAKKEPKPAGYARLPQNTPLPTPRPAQKVAVETETKAPKIAPVAKPETKPAPKSAELKVKKAPSPSGDQEKKEKVQQASVEVKNEPEIKNEPEAETDSFGNPIVKLPPKLTNELKDKRLSKLPGKPNNNLDLKSVITIRYHGLRLLKDGSCKRIQEGGKSLSLAGWIYVICEGDGQYRQFPVQ